jgi:hypothetical protein
MCEKCAKSARPTQGSQVAARLAVGQSACKTSETTSQMPTSGELVENLFYGREIEPAVSGVTAGPLSKLSFVIELGTVLHGFTYSLTDVIMDLGTCRAMLC